MSKAQRVFRSRRYWSRAVQEWRASGKSQREFSESLGVPPSTLSNWVRRLGEPDRSVQSVTTPTFIEVAASVPNTSQTPGPELQVRLVVGSAVVELSQLPPPQYLAAVGMYAEGFRC